MSSNGSVHSWLQGNESAHEEQKPFYINSTTIMDLLDAMLIANVFDLKRDDTKGLVVENIFAIYAGVEIK